MNVCVLVWGVCVFMCVSVCVYVTYINIANCLPKVQFLLLIWRLFAGWKNNHLHFLIYLPKIQRGKVLQGF